MQIAGEIAAFFQSDVLACPAYGSGLVQCYSANVFAHIAMAATFFFVAIGKNFFRTVGWTLFGALVLKELFFDIRAAWPNPIVAIDSAVDLAAYVIGWLLGFTLMMRGPDAEIVTARVTSRG